MNVISCSVLEFQKLNVLKILQYFVRFTAYFFESLKNIQRSYFENESRTTVSLRRDGKTNAHIILFLQYSRLIFNFFYLFVFPGVATFYSTHINITRVATVGIKSYWSYVSCSSHKLYRSVKTGGGQGRQPSPTSLQSSNFLPIL